MRKILAVILSVMLLLGAASAAGESAGKVAIGTISINGAFTLQCGLPEGYTLTPVKVSQEQIIAMIRSEVPEKPVMVLSVAFDETYSDVERMNDLTNEELDILEATYIEDDPGVEITYGETGYGTLLLIARHETETLDYIAFLSIYKGYFIEFVLTPSEQAEDKNLTEDQLKACIDFLTELDFIPAVVPVGGNWQMVAGKTVITNLRDYDAEANTVKAEAMRSITLDPAEIDGLKAGDKLTVGQETFEIDTIEKDEYGDIIINDELILTAADDGLHAYMYDHEYMEAFVNLTLTVPDGVVFVDGINPETGEILEQPTEHTAEELKAMLTAGGYPDFASDNVYVTFDDNGEMTRVERFYTPWQ